MSPIRFCAYQYANRPLTELAERWKRAEGLGFDVLWNCDDLNEPDQPGAIMFEASSILTAMALHTSRIRIGTLVNTLIYRHPTVLAKAAMTIDHISGGRLELGFGGGVQQRDHDAAGVPWWQAAERAARFREAVHLVDQLLRNDVTTWSGQYYRADNAEMCPRPIQQPRPPLTIPAHGPLMLRVAAEYADAWSSWGVTGSIPRSRCSSPRERDVRSSMNSALSQVAIPGLYVTRSCASRPFGHGNRCGTSPT